MKEQIKAYAKRLKLSWIPQHYHQVQANDFEEYLLKLFEQEIEQREQRKVNLLIKQATFPKIKETIFQWNDIQIPNNIEKSYLLDTNFMDSVESLIFYGGVGTGKTFLATLIGLNAVKKGKQVKFYTVAHLVNRLMEANDKGTLGRFFKQLEKLDLLILDELCKAFHNSSYGK